MTVKEYTIKTNELIQNLAKENKSLSGIEIGKDSKIGMNVLNINNYPSIVFSELDDTGNPIKILYCLSIKDMDTIKRLQFWAGKIDDIHSQSQLNEIDSLQLVGGINFNENDLK